MAKKSKVSGFKPAPAKVGSWDSSKRVLGDVMNLAISLAGNKQAELSQAIADVADATLVYAKSLEVVPLFHDYTVYVANSARSFSSYLSKVKAEKIMPDAIGYSKKHPEMAIFGGVALSLLVVGLVAPSFLTSKSAKMKSGSRKGPGAKRPRKSRSRSAAKVITGS